MNNFTNFLIEVKTTTSWWNNWWTSSEQEWGFFHYYFVGIAVPIICLVGLIENSLSIWVNYFTFNMIAYNVH